MSLSYQLLGEAAIAFEGMTNEERASIQDPPTYLTILNESTEQLESYVAELWQFYARAYPIPSTDGEALLWDNDLNRFVPSGQATKGFLLPSLTTAERNGLTNLFVGHQVHDTDTLSPAFYGTGGQWYSLWDRSRNVNDFAGLQAAINDLPAGGGRVILPVGWTETIGDGEEIAIPATGHVTIEAEEPGDSTLIGASLIYTGSDRAIYADTAAGDAAWFVALRGFRVKCQTAGAIGVQLHRCPMYEATRLVVSGPNLATDESSIGIHVDGAYDGASSYTSWYGRISQCRVIGWFKGVMFDGAFSGGVAAGKANENAVRDSLIQENVINIHAYIANHLTVADTSITCTNWLAGRTGGAATVTRGGNSYDVVGVRTESNRTALNDIFIEGIGFGVDIVGTSKSDGNDITPGAHRFSAKHPTFSGSSGTAFRFIDGSGGGTAARNVEIIAPYIYSGITEVSGTPGDNFTWSSPGDESYQNASHYWANKCEDASAYVATFDSTEDDDYADVLKVRTAKSTVSELQNVDLIRGDYAGGTYVWRVMGDGCIEQKAPANGPFFQLEGDYQHYLDNLSGIYMAFRSRVGAYGSAQSERLIVRGAAAIATIEVTDDARLRLNAQAGDNISGCLTLDEKSQDPGAGNYPDSTMWHLYAKGTGLYYQDDAGTVNGPLSPLTTKGDLYTYSTLNARLAVGANSTLLGADSGQATGLKYITRAGTAELADIAAAEAAGSDEKVAFADHVHKHPSGLGVDLHHAQAHGPPDHTAGNNWKVVYQDGSGDEQEVALGANGTFFQANGAAAAPTFAALVVADIPYDDGTSDPLDTTTAAADGVEGSPARKDHAHKLHDHAHAGVAGDGAQLDYDNIFSNTPTGMTGGATHTNTAHTTFTNSFFLPASVFASTEEGTPTWFVTGPGAAYLDICCWALSDATDESIVTFFQVPPDWSSGDMTVKCHWAANNTTAGREARLEYWAYAGAAGEAMGQAQSDTEAVSATDSTTALGLNISTIGTALTVAAGDTVRLTIRRDGDHGDDDMTGSVFVIGVEIEYTAKVGA